ncbi:MAG: undecaprenyl-diphosphate phosphatase, partial [Candidatus Neomarinimicrobiota bacterium]
MSFIDAFIIGALQGLTEFLPISSSGHLVIMQHLLNVNIAGNLVEVAAHVGTLLSVLIFYKKEI